MSEKVIRYCTAYRNGETDLAIMSKPYKPGHPWRFLLDHGFADQGYELIYDKRMPEMVLINFMQPGRVQWAVSTGARRARELFGPGPLLISRCGEPVSIKARFDELDYMLSSRPDRDNNVCVGGMPLPQVIMVMQHNDMGQWAWPARAPKSRFCNYIYSAVREHRQVFCEKMMQYKHVDCAGYAMRNMEFPKPPYSDDWILEKLYFLKDYKFTIAFENQSMAGYVTEKISHPLAVGSIPIYWGCEAVADYYNPKAFINCHDYPDFDAVIEHVKAVDNDPALYQAYLDAPPTLPGQHYHAETMKAKCRRLADDIYAQAEKRRAAASSSGS